MPQYLCPHFRAREVGVFCAVFNLSKIYLFYLRRAYSIVIFFFCSYDSPFPYCTSTLLWLDFPSLLSWRLLRSIGWNGIMYGALHFQVPTGQYPIVFLPSLSSIAYASEHLEVDPI